VVFQMQLAHRLDAVPVTRNYLYPSGEDWRPTHPGTAYPDTGERRSSRGDRRKQLDKA